MLTHEYSILRLNCFFFRTQRFHKGTCVCACTVTQDVMLEMCQVRYYKRYEPTQVPDEKMLNTFFFTLSQVSLSEIWKFCENWGTPLAFERTIKAGECLFRP